MWEAHHVTYPTDVEEFLTVSLLIIRSVSYSWLYPLYLYHLLFMFTG